MYRADRRHAQPSHIRTKDMKYFSCASEKPRAPLRSSDAVNIVFKLFAFQTTKANLSSLNYSIHLFSFFSNTFSHFSYPLFLSKEKAPKRNRRALDRRYRIFPFCGVNFISACLSPVSSILFGFRIFLPILAKNKRVTKFCKKGAQTC